MRVGLISDIHANIVALDAVLEDMPAVDAIACLGDIIGHGPAPRRCVHRIRDVADTVVAGNHDIALANRDKYQGDAAGLAGVDHAISQCTPNQLGWLLDLPERAVAPGELLCVHHHPTIPDKPVFPAEFQNMIRYIADCPENIAGVAMGNTHIQHAETVDGKLLINPGSVGQAHKEDGRANYAIADTAERTTELYDVSYDIEKTIQQIRDAGLLGEAIDRLR